MLLACGCFAVDAEQKLRVLCGRHETLEPVVRAHTYSVALDTGAAVAGCHPMKACTRG